MSWNFYRTLCGIQFLGHLSINLLSNKVLIPEPFSIHAPNDVVNLVDGVVRAAVVLALKLAAVAV